MSALKMPEDPLDFDEVIERIDAALPKAVARAKNNKDSKIIKLRNLKKTQAAFQKMAEEEDHEA